MKYQFGVSLKLAVLLVVALTCVNAVNLTQDNLQAPQYNLTDSVINAKYSSLAFCGQACIQKWNCRGSKQLPFLDPTYLYDKRTMVAGYIGYRPDTKSVLLSLRGSSNNPNWYEDFNFQMLPYQKCKDCFIHAGFFLDFKLLQDKIIENIEKLATKYEVKKIMCTGHSLGAALSIISALEMKIKYGNKYVVESHNFGQPRVGDINLAQFMKVRLDGIFRVIHSHDLVPHLPFEWIKYTHPPSEIFFQSDMKEYKICNESGQDPSCSNQYYPNYTMNDHGFYFIMMDSGSNC